MLMRLHTHTHTHACISFAQPCGRCTFLCGCVDFDWMKLPTNRPRSITISNGQISKKDVLKRLQSRIRNMKCFPSVWEYFIWRFASMLFYVHCPLSVRFVSAWLKACQWSWSWGLRQLTFGYQTFSYFPCKYRWILPFVLFDFGHHCWSGHFWLRATN